jgi:hypothetical protein
MLPNSLIESAGQQPAAGRERLTAVPRLSHCGRGHRRAACSKITDGKPHWTRYRLTASHTSRTRRAQAVTTETLSGRAGCTAGKGARSGLRLCPRLSCGPRRPWTRDTAGTRIGQEYGVPQPVVAYRSADPGTEAVPGLPGHGGAASAAGAVADPGENRGHRAGTPQGQSCGSSPCATGELETPTADPEAAETTIQRPASACCPSPEHGR